ncbi:hypothetical protein J4409_00380 [Candidatus Woesearchaeota archaeon]|nr:hypothetical protein [Candidatus Woesearchaeota archaeon]
MVDIIVKTIPNLEYITVNEIKEILNAQAKKILIGRVIFTAKNIAKFIKNTKSSDVAYIFLKKFKFISQKDIISKIKSIDFSFIKEDFVARCSRAGNHDFTSVDIEKKVGEFIFNNGYKVNLNSKEIIYIDIINNDCIIGRLISNKLGKRSYRIKINSLSITPVLAYSLLKIAKFRPTDSILDPFCKDGVVLLEAFLLKGKELYGIDDYNSIRNAKINSAFAKAKINFYVNDENLNFKPKSIDKIITNLPCITKRSNENLIKKILDSFFKKSSLIAKYSIALITKNNKHVMSMARKNKLKLISSIKIAIGSQNYHIMVFKP